MAQMKSYFELTEDELRSKPALRNFAPFHNVRYVRFKWFCWFWVGDSQASNHKIAVGPFRTKWGAKRAWDKVPLRDVEGERMEAMGIGPTQKRSLQTRFSDNT